MLLRFCFRSGILPAAVLVLAQCAMAFANDAGCEVSRLVSTGAPFPRDPRQLAIRWTGYSNFELAYRGQVLLLDAFFDRGPTYPPLGFTAADIKKAEAILIGHGHFDHMADAATVAKQTGATVVGAPLTTDKLRSQGLDDAHVKTVTGKGGETLKFSHFEIEPILGRHGEPPREVTAAFNHALDSVNKPYTEEQKKAAAAVRSRGTSDPRVITEGTIAYLITLDNGFRIMYRDSGGKITDYENAAMQRVGKVDLALAAVAADVVQSLTTQRALEQLHAYKPALWIPAHHDADLNGMWRPIEPIFQALKDEDPDLITISKQYREPICLDTTKKIQRRAVSGGTAAKKD